VETNAPNSDYKPAFAGQTRVGGVKTQTPYEVKKLSEGLSSPWGITSLPDGRLIITEKGNGTLRIAKPTGELSPAITGLPAVNSAAKVVYWALQLTLILLRTACCTGFLRKV
jgi:glucose/arabinose dehydrogenase